MIFPDGVAAQKLATRLYCVQETTGARSKASSMFMWPVSWCVQKIQGFSPLSAGRGAGKIAPC
jgi:hypothetical protein